MINRPKVLPTHVEWVPPPESRALGVSTVDSRATPLRNNHTVTAEIELPQPLIKIFESRMSVFGGSTARFRQGEPSTPANLNPAPCRASSRAAIHRIASMPCSDYGAGSRRGLAWLYGRSLDWVPTLEAEANSAALAPGTTPPTFALLLDTIADALPAP
ncbi:hypothetical protein GCM10027258_49810 [Amycolatopsis stemonae]